MKNVSNIVMARFRLRGDTVKEWAERNGHKADTVHKTIYGKRGKACRGESAKIRNELERDGFWPKDGDENNISAAAQRRN